MTSILRRTLALVALAVGIGVAAGAGPAAAATTHSAHHLSTHRAIQTSSTGSMHAQDWWFQ